MTVNWIVLPQESGPIAAAVHELMLATRVERGCVHCDLSTQVGERARFRYVEEWREEVDLRRQLRSDRFARLAELVERARERPQVDFELPGGARGLDYAEEVRRGLENPTPGALGA
jgi:quinol monooxygenase YgiN